MSDIRIGTTSSAEFQPLGVAGQHTLESWGTLTAVLRRQLGPAHAALFAEPHVNPARGEVDWYVAHDGPALPLGRAPAAAAAEAEAEWQRLRGEIAALADRLTATPSGGAPGGGQDGPFLAGLLRAALQVPREAEHLIVLLPPGGGTGPARPALIAWGHALSGPQAANELLLGRRQVEAMPMRILPPPPGPVPPPPRLWPWLLALLLSLLLLAAAAWIAWRDPFGWFRVEAGACRIADGDLALLDELRQAEAREGELRRELQRVLAEAAARRADCAPPPAPPRPQPSPQPPPEPPPQPPRTEPTPPPNPDVERARREGGQAGRLQIILAWDQVSDLDLHVTCPNGQHLFFGNESTCGGRLDVDRNAGASGATSQAVENATWPAPAPGRYRIEVDPYALRGARQVPYRITVRQAGKPDQVFQGVARAGQPRQFVADITVDAQ
jgi:hypothetical protein